MVLEHLTSVSFITARTADCAALQMQRSCVMHERLLSSRSASTSAYQAADAKPHPLLPRHHKPVRFVAAAATQSPGRLVAKPAETERKESGNGPGRVFLSSTRAAAGQLWGVLKFFQAEEQAAMDSQTDSSVLGDTANRAEQVGTSLRQQSVHSLYT